MSPVPGSGSGARLCPTETSQGRASVHRGVSHSQMRQRRSPHSLKQIFHTLTQMSKHLTETLPRTQTSPENTVYSPALQCSRCQDSQTPKSLYKAPMLSSPPQTTAVAVKHHQSPAEKSQETQFHSQNAPLVTQKPVSAPYMCAANTGKMSV